MDVSPRADVILEKDVSRHPRSHGYEDPYLRYEQGFPVHQFLRRMRRTVGKDIPNLVSKLVVSQ